MGLCAYVKSCFQSDSCSQWIAPSRPANSSVTTQQHPLMLHLPGQGTHMLLPGGKPEGCNQQLSRQPQSPLLGQSIGNNNLPSDRAQGSRQWAHSCSASLVWAHHKPTCRFCCSRVLVWVSCSEGKTHSTCQQLNSGANHSPVRKYYWTWQLENTAWVQRVKVVLLNLYFLGLAKNVASFSSKAGAVEEGGRTNSTLGQPSWGWSLVPIIYGTVLPVWLLKGNPQFKQSTSQFLT